MTSQVYIPVDEDEWEQMSLVQNGNGQNIKINRKSSTNIKDYTEYPIQAFIYMLVLHAAQICVYSFCLYWVQIYRKLMDLIEWQWKFLISRNVNIIASSINFRIMSRTLFSKLFFWVIIMLRKIPPELPCLPFNDMTDGI